MMAGKRTSDGTVPWGTKRCTVCGDLLTEENATPGAYLHRNYRCRKDVHVSRNNPVPPSVPVPTPSASEEGDGLLEQLRIVSRHPDFKRMLQDMKLEEELGSPATTGSDEPTEEEKG
jgi:hypothetical protein